MDVEIYLSFLLFFRLLFSFFALIGLTPNAITGHSCQRRHPRILRPGPSLFILDGVLKWRPTSQYPRTGVSRRIRRDPRGRAGTALAADRHHAGLAVILHGLDETVPAKVRDAGVDAVRD
jgi:hypothetical protein